MEAIHTMPTEHSTDRRTFLATGGTLVAVGLAGCSGGDDDGDGGGGGGDGGGGDVSYVDEEPDYGGWLDDVDDYEGTVDATGQSSVAVDVGAGPDGFRFDPVAIAVDPGTTVTWEWTGRGDQHNVVDEGGGFESDRTAAEGFTFEQPFDDSGTTKYYCDPHRTLGMKGAVYVP